MAKKVDVLTMAGPGRNKVAWLNYFHMALDNLTAAPVVAEWNPADLVKKAHDIADLALQAELNKSLD